MTYEDIIDAGGPASNRLLSCTQRLKNCNSEELLGKNYMLMVRALGAQRSTAPPPPQYRHSDDRR